MEQARAASRMVRGVNLERAGKSDPSFLASVDSAIEAIEEVENGVLDQDPLVALLQGSGFGKRLDKIYTGDRGEPHMDIARLAHRNGLPPFEVALAPDYSPIDGLHGVFVTRRGVFTATIPHPIEDHEWRVVRNVPHESDKDLVKKVSGFVSSSPQDRFR